MEKIIFFGLVIPIIAYVLYLGATAIMETPIRFKASAEKYGFKKDDAIIFKIGELNSLEDLLN